ncbi:MAG: hypothetical protein ACI82F_002097 [Planctomycetota bacterium]|jgi:hypothetical protein
MIRLSTRAAPPTPSPSTKLRPIPIGVPRPLGRQFAFWFLIGFGIRLAFLPLTVHPDLLAVYYRIDLWRQGVLGPQDFHLQSLPMLVHRCFAALLTVPLPDLTGLPWPGTPEEIYGKTQAVLSSPGSVALVFLWKLPYLLVDLACAFVAMRLVPRARRLATFRLWMLHPILLYVVVVFGKFEPFMMLPLLLGLLDLKEGRERRGFLWLGVSIAMRIYPVFVVLPMILAVSPSPRRRLESYALLGAPLLLVLSWGALDSSMHFAGLCFGIAALVFSYGRLQGRPAEPLLWVAALIPVAILTGPILGVIGGRLGEINPLEWHGARLFDGRVTLYGNDAILIFSLVFGVVCLWAHELAQVRDSRSTRQRVFDDSMDVALVAGLAFFGFCSLNPQYFVLLGALAILRLHRAPEMAAAHALQVLGLLLYMTSFPGGSVSTWLFAPLAPTEILSLPGPLELLPTQLAWIEWAAFGRVLLLLGCLWMAWKIVRSRRSDIPTFLGSGARSGTLIASSLCWPVALILCLIAPAQQMISVHGSFEPSAVSLNRLQPLDGMVLHSVPGIPVALQARRERIAPGRVADPLGHQIEVTSTGTTDGAKRVLHMPDGALVPDGEGIINIPLVSLRLQPERTYDLTWREHNAAAPAGLEARIVYELDGAAVVKRIAQGALERARQTPFALLWFLGLASIFLGALVISRWKPSMQ